MPMQIRALIWKDLSHKEEILVRAAHPFGEYTITRDPEMEWPFVLRPFISGQSNYRTLDEAKSAADVDFANKANELLGDTVRPYKHTEAPWRVAGKNGHIIGRDTSGGDPNGIVHVAVVGNYQDPEVARFNKSRWDADASLIAAAPDLLFALKNILDSIEIEANDHRALMLGLAAIEKAEKC